MAFKLSDVCLVVEKDEKYYLLRSTCTWDERSKKWLTHYYVTDNHSETQETVVKLSNSEAASVIDEIRRNPAYANMKVCNVKAWSEVAKKK